MSQSSQIAGLARQLGVWSSKCWLLQFLFLLSQHRTRPRPLSQPPGRTLPVSSTPSCLGFLWRCCLFSVLSPWAQPRVINPWQQLHKLIGNWMFVDKLSLINCFDQDVSVKVPGGNRWQTQLGELKGEPVKTWFPQECAPLSGKQRDFYR